MGCRNHCIEEKHFLIRNLHKQGRTYKEIQHIDKCLPTIVANALNFELKHETRERKINTTTRQD